MDPPRKAGPLFRASGLLGAAGDVKSTTSSGSFMTAVSSAGGSGVRHFERGRDDNERTRVVHEWSGHTDMRLHHEERPIARDAG